MDFECLGHPEALAGGDEPFDLAVRDVLHLLNTFNQLLGLRHLGELARPAQSQSSSNYPHIDYHIYRYIFMFCICLIYMFRCRYVIFCVRSF